MHTIIDTNRELDLPQHNGPRLDQLSVTHSTLSLIPYHLAVEYFALPIGMDI
jgi:hypothetical protein